MFPRGTPAGDAYEGLGDPDVSAETSGIFDADMPEDEYPVGARRADALRHLAGQYLASQVERSGGSSDRYQVVVHIDQRLLSEASSSSSPVAAPGADGRPNELSGRVICEFEDGPTLAAATARRLACDGSLVGMVDNEEGEPLNVGRKTRAIPPALARALRARDKGCRFPGCTHTRFTEGHHVEHWADGGETKLTNLITLCHFHHHLVHEGGFGVGRTDDGAFIFRNPAGDRLPEHIPAERCFSADNLATLNRGRGVDIPPEICFTRWHGERMDYSIAIDCLLAARQRAAADGQAAGDVRAAAVDEASHDPAEHDRAASEEIL